MKISELFEDIKPSPITNSPEFKKWFNGSKVVDDEGNPMMMYHGSPHNIITQFEVGYDYKGNKNFEGNRKVISFTSDPIFASGYTGVPNINFPFRNPTVYPVYIKSINPGDFRNPVHIKKVIDYRKNILENTIKNYKNDEKLSKFFTQERIDNEWDSFIKFTIPQIKHGSWQCWENPEMWDLFGWDGAWMRETINHPQQNILNFAITDGKQVKSAYGNKTFNPDSSNITETQLNEGCGYKGASRMQTLGCYFDMKISELFEDTKLTPITKSPEFKKWFDGSKVVDGNGNPLICYHGTKNDFHTFDLERHGTAHDFGWFGKGFYFTSDSKQAAIYAQNDKGYVFKQQGHIIPVYLKITNPYITDQNSVSENHLDEIRAEGYDGIFHVAYRYRDMVPDEIIVFEPNQIKSIFNKNFTNKGNISESETLNVPIYDHDCPQCVFCGHTSFRNHNVVDVYVCNPNQKDKNYMTIVLRYSDDPGAYYSTYYKIAKENISYRNAIELIDNKIK